MKSQARIDFEGLCRDAVQCCYDDQGNLLHENMKTAADMMTVLSRITEAEQKLDICNIENDTKLEIAKTEAEQKLNICNIENDTKLEIAKIEAATKNIDGIGGLVVDVLKAGLNTLNLRSVIWAEDTANKIVSSKFLGFIKKQP